MRCQGTLAIIEDESSLASDHYAQLYRRTEPIGMAVQEHTAQYSAAQAANWKPGEKGNGVRGLGIAYARYKTIATYNAVVAEVEVDRVGAAKATYRGPERRLNTGTYSGQDRRQVA